MRDEAYAAGEHLQHAGTALHKQLQLQELRAKLPNGSDKAQLNALEELRNSRDTFLQKHLAAQDAQQNTRRAA